MDHPFAIECPTHSKYPHTGSGTIQYIFCFRNGYGASIVPEYDFLGLELIPIPDEYELAVTNWSMEGGEYSYSLNYSTPITSDVLRHQTKEQISELLHQICRLERLQK